MKLVTAREKGVEYIKGEIAAQVLRLQNGCKFLLSIVEDPDCNLNLNTIFALQEANKDLTAGIGFLMEENIDEYEIDEEDTRDLQ